ncbi:MAG: hypothetical protein US42_C0008G0066 [Candidatus Magasanikbacteria bacterium GW2011_GWC2_37_14]|uniref:Uncharacterized protein n=1 Tax=Candidatus Magasanikbacteria bacterium GW2011_GWC2_37_14 TaxID=1619046 RepID=A0A0G0GN17_9BACT|nr:MAG: hypothetical protein US42_C0008G0066 [Candidatus Magasanikbacteria bacterium GW2011_GWC2_37_14]
MKKIFITLALFTILLTPVFVFSANTGLGALTKNLSDTGKAAEISETGTLQDIVGTGIGAALTLVGLIFMILMVYGGYLWMVARGAEEMITKAKGIITAAIIGLVVVISAYAITVFITGRFQ